jgi:hypothetical protein
VGGGDGFGPAGTALSVGHGRTLARTRSVSRGGKLAGGPAWPSGPQPRLERLGQFQGVVGRTVNRGRPGCIIQINFSLFK